MGELRMHVAIIFEDRELTFPLWFLRKGFRHCFLILADEQKTLIIDPTLRRTYVEHLSGFRFYDVVDTIDLQKCNLDIYSSGFTISFFFLCRSH